MQETLCLLLPSSDLLRSFAHASITAIAESVIAAGVTWDDVEYSFRNASIGDSI